MFLFIFFPVTLFFYFIVKNDKAKNIVLVIASLIFYSWGEPVWVCLLIFSSILDYTVSLGIEKYRGKKITKLFIALSVVINLGLLAAFKYSGFFHFHAQRNLPPLAPCSRIFFADRHLVLYIPDDVLFARCLQRRC